MPQISHWPRLLGETLRLSASALRGWGARQVIVAVVAATGIAVVMGLATVLIPNSFFSRDIPTVPWNYPVWLLTSALMGLLIATYVAPAGDRAARTGGAADLGERRDARTGTAAGMLAWFAVGCPVCNKLALLALGYSGALTWFAPAQPVLAVLALVLSVIAVLSRLRGQVACPLPAPEPSRSAAAL
ncbi:MAG: hypothetical protein L0H39_13820 [Brachybacterium sp.]|nr:hypothetical protein [Brachybacterium sp.]